MKRDVEVNPTVINSFSDKMFQKTLLSLSVNLRSK